MLVALGRGRLLCSGVSARERPPDGGGPVPVHSLGGDRAGEDADQERESAHDASRAGARVGVAGSPARECPALPLRRFAALGWLLLNPARGERDGEAGTRVATSPVTPDRETSWLMGKPRHGEVWPGLQRESHRALGTLVGRTTIMPCRRGYQ